MRTLVTQSCLTLWPPCTVACQPPLSMGFFRQEYWSGLYFFLQGICLTQRSSLSLLHCSQILYCLRNQGSPYNGILLIKKMNEILPFLDGLGGYYAKRNKSDRERQILHDFTYLWNLKKEQTNKLIETENRLVVSKSQVGEVQGESIIFSPLIMVYIPTFLF